MAIFATPSIHHASEISSTTPLKTLNVHFSDVVTDRDAKTIPFEVIGCIRNYESDAWGI